MRTCTLCKHPEREAIDRAIIANDSVRDIAGHFSVSKSAVDRHKPHITALVTAHSADRAESLQSDISTARRRSELLYQAAESILAGAVQAQDLKAALAAVRTATQVLGEARNLMELRGGYESQQTEDPQTVKVREEVQSLLVKHDAEVRAKARAELLAELGLPAPGAEVQALIQ